MKRKNKSLLFWVSVRIVIVAIVTLFTIILAMWGIFAAQYFYVIHEMPASVYERFLVLRENPSLDARPNSRKKQKRAEQTQPW